MCSECGASLEGKQPQTKTCSTNCRVKRSRRIKASRAKGGTNHGLNEHQAEISARVRGETADIAHRVIEEELRPVVREAITEETLRAISDMVGLAPRAVEKIGAESEDSTVRQRAYSLITKYTVGHPSIVKPEETDSNQQLNINFQLPRPTDDASEVIEVESAVELEDDGETRACDLCGEDKTVTQFVAGSDRCVACFDQQQERAKAILGSTPA